MHSYWLQDFYLLQHQTHFTIYRFSLLFNMQVHFWNKDVLVFIDEWGLWVLLTHFVIPTPAGQFLFEWQYMGTWKNCWILTRLCLFVLKVYYHGCILFFCLFLTLIMKVLSSWPLLNSATAEYKTIWKRLKLIS